MTIVHPQPLQCDHQAHCPETYAAQPPQPRIVQQQPGYSASGYDVAGQLPPREYGLCAYL